MDKKFHKYLESIRISHENNSYVVFTDLTSHFSVKTLNELTVERFEQAEEDFKVMCKRREESQSNSNVSKSRRSFFKE